MNGLNRQRKYESRAWAGEINGMCVSLEREGCRVVVLMK